MRSWVGNPVSRSLLTWVGYEHLLNASSLAVASFIILAGLAAGYLYLYSLYRRPYFAWMAAGWGLNAAYVSAETWVASLGPDADRASLLGINALSIIAFYLALADLRRFAVRSRGLGSSGLVVILGLCVVLSSCSGSIPPKGEALLLSVIAVLYALPLLGLARGFALATPGDVLRVLQNEAPDADESVAVRNPDVVRILKVTRNLLIVSFAVYALLQLSYPLMKVVALPASTFVVLFVVAFLTKILHGLALPLWALADLRARLEALREQAVNEEIGVLAVSVQHDIKGALGVMRKELDNIGFKYPHDASLRDRVRRLNEYLDRIAAATDIVPMAREMDMEFRRRSERTNVVAIVRSAADTVRKLDRKGDIRLIVESDRSEIMVQADRPRLTQALVHILNNGVEACRAKGPAPPYVAVRCLTGGSKDEVKIIVRDHGTGLSPEIRPRLTKPFLTTKAGEGRNRGLGLFVAARVIRMHSGTLSFHSDGHSYTEVIVTLPRASSTETTSRTD